MSGSVELTLNVGLLEHVREVNPECRASRISWGTSGCPQRRRLAADLRGEPGMSGPSKRDGVNPECRAPSHVYRSEPGMSGSVELTQNVGLLEHVT